MERKTNKVVNALKEAAYKIFSSGYGGDPQSIQNPYYTEVHGKSPWVDYGMFGDQTTPIPNAYIDYLFSLYNRSIQHSKLIDIKSEMTYGQGWDNLPQELLSNINQTESFNSVLDSDCFNSQFSGAFALKIYWDQRSQVDPTYAKPARIEAIPIQNVRLGDPYQPKYKDFVFLCEDWSGRGRGGYATKEKQYHKFSLKFDDIKEYPVQVLYKPLKRAGNAIYGRPPYGYQTDFFEIDYEIPKFHLTGLKRGAFATLHIHNSNGLPGTELSDQGVFDFNQKYTGTQGARVYHTYSDGEENKVTFNTVDLGISDQKFLTLWEKNTEAIFKAHGVDMKLLGADKGGISIGRDDLLEVIEKTQVQNINKVQGIIEDTYKEIYSKSGLNYDWKIKKYQINIRKIKTTTQDIMLILASAVSNPVKIELLKDAGVENPERYVDATIVTNPDGTTTDATAALSDSGTSSTPPKTNSVLTNLTGKQQQGLDRIVRKYDKGIYTDTQALLLITSGYGLTTEEATAYLNMDLGTEE